MTRPLPDRANLEQLRKQAKDLLALWRSGESARVAPYGLAGTSPSLSSAQLVVAREYGFDSWPKLRQSVRSREHAARTLCDLAFGDSVAPSRAEAIEKLLREHPGIHGYDFAAACICGEPDVVGKALADDPGIANRRVGPANREPILYLCFSSLLRTMPERRAGFEESAKRLLEAGANPNVAYDFEGWPLSALYAAVAVAKNATIAKLLMKAGANLNDGETCYHGVEEPGLPVLREVFVDPDLVSRTHALFRKLDFEDIEGLRWLLEHGVEATLVWEEGKVTALHQAIRRGRSVDTVRLLIEHGADPFAADLQGRTPYTYAMRSGRIDVAKLLADLGASTDVDPQDAYLAAIVAGEKPAPVPLDPDRLAVVAEAAWEGDFERLMAFLDAGLPVDGTPGHQTALHSACWIGRADMVRELLRRGASMTVRDPVYDSTPLGWCCHGSLHSGRSGHLAVAQALLDAGAPLPSQDSGWPNENEAAPDIRAAIHDAIRSQRHT